MHATADLLRAKIPMEGLTRGCLQYLAGHTAMENHPPGEVLFQIGDKDPVSIYLLEGAVRMECRDGAVTTIRADDPSARFPLANLRPRRYRGIVVEGEAKILRVPADFVEKCVAIEQLSTGDDLAAMAHGRVAGAARDPWIQRMLKTTAFMSLPIDNLLEMVHRVENVPVEAGDVVVRQDDPGDYFYILAEGRAKVTRSTPTGEVVLDEIGVGQPFGESALVSGMPRNATVTMLTDGMVKRLGQQDFKSLVEKPLTHRIKATRAAGLLDRGAIPIDVRTEEEFAQYSIPGAVNIPLYLLRVKMKSLPRDKEYVVFCDTGVRSATAVFLLTQAHFRAYTVEGGLGPLSAVLEGRPVGKG